MVDLVTQYEKIKDRVDQSIQEVIYASRYINGPEVHAFQNKLEQFLGVKHVIPCANGTDALQISLMALELPPECEVLVPTFNYVATAEVIALLGLKPLFVDVDPHTFNIDLADAEQKITKDTKAIMPVHLFGQCADMQGVMALAERHDLKVIEDVAQAIGARCQLANGEWATGGTIGHVGTTSFFPSKNLGCMGDGGAIFTNDDDLAVKLRMIASHGQSKKYYFGRIGVNSRLDTMQAAILNVKLDHLDHYIHRRQSAAEYYDSALSDHGQVKTPVRSPQSTHVFHQYTLQLNNGRRDEIKQALADLSIPSMVYYPLPLHLQEAYGYLGHEKGDFPVSEALCHQVLSLPMHTELSEEQLSYIVSNLRQLLV